MKELTPGDFTQTVVGAASTSRSNVSQLSVHATLEGRFPPGTLLNGRYRIIALPGKGGMGEVYRATDLTLGVSVALKFLPGLATSDPRWLERFHSEVRIARQVSHPNVCRVYDIGEAEGLPFLSMEYVDGEDLSTLLRRIGRLPADKAIEISRKACAGLSAAHSKGVIHRDLKPHNIMLDRHGEVLICDFGLAAVATELNAAEIRQGTPAYMAPEQLKGTEVTQASDIYSLGLVLYELFTGKRAYSAPNINEMLNLQEAMSLTSMSSHASDIDPAVENIIRKCLDPMPSQRPQSALSIAAALPGGDPLAAALAAGQTPTPEMVAASKSEGLKTRYSVPMLAFSLIILALFPYLKGHVEMLEYSPVDTPRAALMQKAREMVIQFGYPDKPADWMDYFETRPTLMQWLLKQKPKDWRNTLSGESPLIYLYRQSPRPLAEGPDGEVSWDRPALNVANMVRMNMDSTGRLRYFEAVPPRSEDAGNGPFEESKLFQAMGFDRSKFSSTDAVMAPLTPFDQRVTLKGPHGGLQATEVIVQYATWKGRLTSLYVRFPFSQPLKDTQSETPIGVLIQMYIVVSGIAVFLFFSIALARRNWLSNRADRKGALKLFGFRVAVSMLAWALSAHYFPDARMIGFAAYALSMSLLSGYILWQLYLALEPALRLRWPQAIVTWNRLVSGRIKDAEVGAHILMGVVMGLSLDLFFLMKNWFNFERTGELELANVRNTSAGPWLAHAIATADNALTTGMLIFFCIFGLKVLLKREWLAMLVAAMLLCVTNQDLYRSTNLVVDLASYFAAGLLIMFGLVRFGMLTTIVAVFVVNYTGQMQMTSDPKLWFMPGSIASLILVGALAVYAFWRSLGTQSLVGEAPK